MDGIPTQTGRRGQLGAISTEATNYRPRQRGLSVCTCRGTPVPCYRIFGHAGGMWRQEGRRLIPSVSLIPSLNAAAHRTPTESFLKKGGVTEEGAERGGGGSV